MTDLWSGSFTVEYMVHGGAENGNAAMASENAATTVNLASAESAAMAVTPAGVTTSSDAAMACQTPAMVADSAAMATTPTVPADVKLVTLPSRYIDTLDMAADPSEAYHFCRVADLLEEAVEHHGSSNDCSSPRS